MSVTEMKKTLDCLQPSLGTMESGLLHAEMRRCRDADVPMVCVPQSVIYELTNISKNGYNNEQDTIHHELSNQNKLDCLCKHLETVSHAIKTTISNLDIALKIAESEYTHYTTLFIHSNKANNFDFPDVSSFASIDISKAAEEKLSDDQKNTIAKLNKLFAGVKCDKKDVEDALNESKKSLNNTTNHIVKLSATLVKLEKEKAEIQTELILEQSRALAELKNNPARVLEGEEILQNHWENCLRVKEGYDTEDDVRAHFSLNEAQYY